MVYDSVALFTGSYQSKALILRSMPNRVNIKYGGVVAARSGRLFGGVRHPVSIELVNIMGHSADPEKNRVGTGLSTRHALHTEPCFQGLHPPVARSHVLAKLGQDGFSRARRSVAKHLVTKQVVRLIKQVRLVGSPSDNQLGACPS
jgi:hypothetical protein